MKMQKKKLVIATTVAIITFLAMFSALSATMAINESSAFYTVTNGNLNTDTYTQYPFEANNVSFGFSKYGELIGIEPGQNQAVQTNWVGMEYDGRDPFAPSTPSIPQYQWINGWYLWISYIDPNEPNKDRNLWAFALFSDGHVAGGDWIINVTGTPTSMPFGGRKTNGMVITDAMQVLYDGPREYIAQSTNHIYDNDGTTQWPVVDLIITMIFNKVSKQVILYKDVKTTIDKLNLWGKLNVQLSDREEYDLGPDPNHASYAHFYEEQGWTSYTPSWSIAQNLTTDYIETQLGKNYVEQDLDGSTWYLLHPYNDYPVSTDYMKVYINGVFQDPSLGSYTVQYGTSTYVIFPSPLPDTAVIKFYYKYVFKGPCYYGMLDGASPSATVDGSRVPTWAHEYDYAQVISSDNLYVAWAAMWPPTSSHTVDGILNFLQPFYSTRTDILSSAPKRSPLIVGQWDIAMDPATFPMFRGVEVKGICNYHDAQDPQEGSGEYRGTTLDIEAQYQLDSVFTPYDLKSAITKNLNTWVDYWTVTANELLEYPTYFPIPLVHSPVHDVYPWETYDSQSERVFLNGVLQYPDRNLVGQTSTYELYLDTDGTGYVVFYTSDLSKGDVIKIIYATDVCNYAGGFTIYSTIQYPTVETTGSFDFSGSYNWLSSLSWTDALHVNHDLSIRDFDGSFTPPVSLPAGNTTWTYTGQMIGEAKDFTVFKEDTTTLEIGAEDFSANMEAANPSGNSMQIGVNDFRIKWEITGPYGSLFTDLLDVMMSIKKFYINFAVTIGYVIPNTGNPYFNATASINFEPAYGDTLYKEKIPGRYEWGIVGTKSQPVDSAGLSLISAALKDKEVEYGTAGSDINATDPTLQMPWIFSKMSTGTSTPWSPYYYSATDSRTGLKDDWDPVGYDWQIAGANLVASGGPLANMLSYYGNDFATTFYGISQFTQYGPWNGAIVSVPCWNSTANKAYFTSAKYGYATISTFEDINGTTGLLVWGVWGRDTYYAAQWFYQDLIQEFQSFPCGATSIVLQITYNTTTLKPKAFNVVEVLGTISETGIVSEQGWQPYVWGVTTPIKGGIHPDP
jgi:hypothetical protein